MKIYGTPENYLRCYGGEVKASSPSMDADGNLSLVFSRPIVFPQELLVDFEPDYVEDVPPLEMTEDELD